MNYKQLFSSALANDRTIDAQFEDTYTLSTTSHRTQIDAILKPVDEEEISAILKIANEHKIAIHPISGGKNWGYSDSSPAQDKAVILDLSLMNQIVEYNDTLSYITVQPGVTQKQLACFLKDHGDKHIMSVTGSSPYASITGNYLERGFGMPPLADHADAVTSIQAILPDGTYYQSQLSHLGCTKVDKLYKHGLGPHTDGLFFQSNYGIVTQMTIKLALKPAHNTVVIAQTNGDNLSHVIDSLRCMRQQWDIPNISIKVFNSLYSLAASQIPYPKEYMDRNDHLPQSVIDQVTKDNKIADFIIVITCAGPKVINNAVARELKKRLNRITDSIVIINEFRHDVLFKLKNFIPSNVRKKLDTIFTAWSLYKGTPSDKMLKLAYWRNRNKTDKHAEINPAKDGCGIIWYAPIIPFDGVSTKKYEAFFTKTCKKFDINPIFNFSNTADNYLIAVSALIFDPKTQGEKARLCYLALMEEGIKLGFPPYRLPFLAMDQMLTTYPSDINTKIKNALDTNNILSPKKYTSAE